MLKENTEKSKKDLKHEVIQEVMSNYSDTASNDFDSLSKDLDSLSDEIESLNTSIKTTESLESVLNAFDTENKYEIDVDVNDVDEIAVDVNEVDEINVDVNDVDEINVASNDFVDSDPVDEIRIQFLNSNIEIPYDEIKSRFDELTETFKVSKDEAKRCVVNYYAKKNNLNRNLFHRSGSASLKKISEINDLSSAENESGSGKLERTLWANVAVNIVRIWDNPHETILQSGIAGDETGIVRFTIWKSSDLSEVVENKSYCFKNVVLREWNGRYNIELNRASSIEELKKPVSVSKEDVEKIYSVDRRQNVQIPISDLTGDIWTDLKVRVLKIWDNTHESIKQSGVVGDETGIVKFTIWNTSDAEEMKEDECYLIKNTIIKEWNGKFTAEINKTSSIEKIDEDIKVNFEKVTITGASVAIQSGSGLIKRCPECNKVISRGFCNDHGKVKGVYDLRIKAVIDDGKETQDVIINRELTEKLSQTTLDEAINYVTETLDTDSFVDNLKLSFIGRYYKITGSKTERYIIADSVEPESFEKSKEKDILISLIKDDLISVTDAGAI
ncbi:MAG: replication protein A [Methanosarcinaceae archaeon]|nr:replication protein A [Methanosarcinaceae archaeon]